MGNTAAPLKPRDRADSGSGASGRRSAADDDQCPVVLKMAKNSSPGASMASLQFENSDQYPVVVKWAGGIAAKQVSICGSWDGWKRKIPLVKSHDDFTTIMNLPEGKHEFKFYVDGSWVCDNTLPKTDNPLGSENNVILIDRGDFEVFDALDRDLAATNIEKGSGDMTSTVDGTIQTSDEAQKSFGQNVPDRREFEKATHPPVLPPHLLQVILNKDTPVSCDPNVLPEPNHVMLNHLYALSIKDGVMVLSGTHRYRKKYVTTLLYKPI